MLCCNCTSFVITSSSISSHAGSIHLMLKQPNNWQEVLTSLAYQHITEVDIYFGLLISNEGYQQKQIDDCITGVIDTVKPQIIGVHFMYTSPDNIKKLVHLLNQRQYLIQESGEMWYIWYR